MDLAQALAISASGMNAQTERLRIIAENLSDHHGTNSNSGAMPCPPPMFMQMADHVSGTRAFRNAGSTMRTPDVDGSVQVMDMGEAERSYSTNLDVMQASRSMLTRTIELLKR